MTAVGIISLGEIELGRGARCLIIGEVAQAHDGSLGLAHAFIDAMANAGADGVKFQTHIAAAESTPEEPFRVQLSGQDRTRYDYWRRMEFTEAQWRALADHARQRRLMFLSSPFSLEAVELLQRVGVVAWKLASGEVTNIPMIERMLATGHPILVSTGMSPMAEIDQTIEVIRARGRPFMVLQCTSQYPCPPEAVGLNVLEVLRTRYHCPVGLSDHSGTIYPGLAACALGAELIEVHVTLSREMSSPDGPASITTVELRQLVEGVQMIERMRAHPVDKDRIAAEMTSMRALFCKSLVARSALPAGHVMGPEDLTTKKPGTGLPPGRLREFVGRHLRRPVAADQILHEEDFEEAPSKRTSWQRTGCGSRNA